MSLDLILKKSFKEGYYLVTYGAVEYANTESEALRILSAWDKMGSDSAVYKYRDGVFRRCLVVDLLNFSLNNNNRN